MLQQVRRNDRNLVEPALEETKQQQNHTKLAIPKKRQGADGFFVNPCSPLVPPHSPRVAFKRGSSDFIPLNVRIATAGEVRRDLTALVSNLKGHICPFSSYFLLVHKELRLVKAMPVPHKPHTSDGVAFFPLNAITVVSTAKSPCEGLCVRHRTSIATGSSIPRFLRKAKTDFDVFPTSPLSAEGNAKDL